LVEISTMPPSQPASISQIVQNDSCELCAAVRVTGISSVMQVLFAWIE
jgi:hypothetical protein